MAYCNHSVSARCFCVIDCRKKLDARVNAFWRQKRPTENVFNTVLARNRARSNACYATLRNTTFTRGDVRPVIQMPAVSIHFAATFSSLASLHRVSLACACLLCTLRPTCNSSCSHFGAKTRQLRNVRARGLFTINLEHSFTFWRQNLAYNAHHAQNSLHVIECYVFAAEACSKIVQLLKKFGAKT